MQNKRRWLGYAAMLLLVAVAAMGVLVANQHYQLAQMQAAMDEMAAKLPAAAETPKADATTATTNDALVAIEPEIPPIAKPVTPAETPTEVPTTETSTQTETPTANAPTQTVTTAEPVAESPVQTETPVQVETPTTGTASEPEVPAVAPPPGSNVPATIGDAIDRVFTQEAQDAAAEAGRKFVEGCDEFGHFMGDKTGELVDWIGQKYQNYKNSQ